MNKLNVQDSTRIIIFGLGLMGGSLAAAIKSQNKMIIGIDPDPKIRQYALEQHFVQEVHPYPPQEKLVGELVILAAPVKTNLAILDNLEKYISTSATILDLSSTKLQVVQRMAKLPAQFDPIGGHPMCGKETGSIFHADPMLYQNAQFALVPLDRTTKQARSIIEKLVVQIGAKPYWINAELHDQMVAVTSHLPFLVANVLAAITPIESKTMIGPGFRSTTRLAGSDLTMMLDILETNRDNILKYLDDFHIGLATIEYALNSNDYAKLLELLDQGKQQRASLLGEQS
jgi:prephenate dehydrogenase